MYGTSSTIHCRKTRPTYSFRSRGGHNWLSVSIPLDVYGLEVTLDQTVYFENLSNMKGTIDSLRKAADDLEAAASAQEIERTAEGVRVE